MVKLDFKAVLLEIPVSIYARLLKYPTDLCALSGTIFMKK